MGRYRKWNSKTMRMEWVEDTSTPSSGYYIQRKDGSVGTTTSFTKSYRKWDDTTKSMKWADDDGNIQITEKQYKQILKEQKKQQKKKEKSNAFINTKAKKDLGWGWNVLATATDVLSEVGKGVFGTAETLLVDLPTTAVGFGVGMFDKKKGKSIRNWAAKSYTNEYFDNNIIEQYSYMGDFLDTSAETITSFLFTGGLGAKAANASTKLATTSLTAAKKTGDAVKIAKATKAVQNAGKISRWVPLYTKAATQATLQADQEGANPFQSITYGVLSGATEVATEQMFSFMGNKVATKLGIGGFKGIGGKTSLDELVVGAFTKGMKNGVVKNILQSGAMAAGEGFEELIAGYASALYKSTLSLGGRTEWLRGETLDDLLRDEELGKSFALGMFTSAIMGMPSAVYTGYTTGESVVSNATEEQIAETKQKINEEVAKLEKGPNYRKAKRELTKRLFNEMEQNALNEYKNLKDDGYFKELSTKLNDMQKEANTNLKKLSLDDLRTQIKLTGGLIIGQDNGEGLFGADTYGKYYAPVANRIYNEIYIPYIDELEQRTKKMSTKEKTERIQEIAEKLPVVDVTPENNMSEKIALIEEQDILAESLDEGKDVKTETNKIKVRLKQEKNFALAEAYVEMINEQLKREKLDGEVKLSNISEKGLRAWEKQTIDLCKGLGIQLIYLDSDINFKGMTLPNVNGIQDTVTVMFYNRNKGVHPTTVKAEIRDGKTTYKANVQEELLFTMGHEIYHHMISQESELAKNILKFVKQNVTEEEITEFVQRRYGYSNEAQNEILEDKNKLFEEMAADEFATLIMNEDFLSKIKQAKPELATQIEELTKKILRSTTQGSFYSNLTNRGVETLLRVFDATIEKSQETVDKLIEQENQMKTPENIQKGHDAYKEYAEKGVQLKEQERTEEIETLKNEVKELKKLVKKPKVEEKPKKKEVKQKIEKPQVELSEVDQRIAKKDDPLEILTDYLLDNPDATFDDIDDITVKLKLNKKAQELADQMIDDFFDDNIDFAGVYDPDLNKILEKQIEEQPKKQEKVLPKKTTEYVTPQEDKIKTYTVEISSEQKMANDKRYFEKTNWNELISKYGNDNARKVVDRYVNYLANGGDPIPAADRFVKSHSNLVTTVEITTDGAKLMTGTSEYRESQSIKTILNSQSYKNLITKTPQLLNEVRTHYQTKTTKQVETNAINLITNNLDKVVKTISDVANGDNGIVLNSDYTVAAQMLWEIALKENDKPFIRTIGEALARSTTNAAQIVAYQKRLLDSGNPDLAVTLVGKDIYKESVKKLKNNPNDTILKTWINEKFNDDGTIKNMDEFGKTTEFGIISLITGANQTIQESDVYTQEEKDIQSTIAINMIKGVLTHNAPVSLNWSGKLTNFRKLAMLSRVKTQQRNILSNYLMYGFTNLSNIGTVVGDRLLSSVIDKNLTPEMKKEWKKFGETTKQFTTLSSVEKSYAKQLGEQKAQRANYINKTLGINIFDTSTEFRDTKFNSEFLNKWSNKLNFLMEKFDTEAFAQHLAIETMRQQKIIAEEQGKTNLTPEELSQIKLSPQKAQRCIEIAREATFKSKNSTTYNFSKKLVDGINDAFNQFIPNSNIGTLMQPFLLTPANVGQILMEASPAGVAMSFTQYRQLKSMLNNQEQYSPTEIAQKQRDLARTIGRNLAGAIIMTIGRVLGEMGVITGEGPDDEEEKELLKSQGWQPYSINLGGTYITYDWATPAGAVLGMGANFSESELSWNSMFTDVINATGEQFKENTVLETLAPLFNEGYGDDTLMSRLGGVVSNIPSSYVPGFLQEIADTIDPTTKQTYDKNILKSMYQQTVARIPFLKSTLTTKTDRLGNPVGKSPFNILIPAGNITTSTDNNGVGEHIIDLMNESGNNNLLPPKADTTLTYKVDNVQKKVTFTKEQQLQLTKKAGDIYSDVINHMLTQNSYLNASIENKVKMIDLIREYAKGKAVTDSGFAPGYISGNNNYEKLNKYIESGLTLENALQLAVYVLPIKGDKDADGKTITGTQLARRAYQIMSYNIPSDQKDIMLQLIQDSKNPETTYTLSNLLSEQEYKNYFSLSKNDTFVMKRYSRNDYQNALKLGIDGDSFMDFYQTVDNIEPDYYSNGKEVSGSKKNKIIKYLNSTNLNMAQKAYLLSQQGYSVKQYRAVMTNYLNSLSDMTYEEKLALYEEMFPMQ